MPIEKLGPHLKTTEKAIDALLLAGFNSVTLANNHLRDYGDMGVSDTLFHLERKGVMHVGAGLDLDEAKKSMMVNIGGCKICIINACEQEFSLSGRAKAGANPLNPIQQYYAIQEERRSGADRIVVIIHGGHEHFQLPSQRMVETYRFFIDAGANAVVNHHQHCYSGYELYKGKPIFYGLGNFCFDREGCRNGIWNEGYMVTLDLTNEQPLFTIHPYRQGDEKAGVELLPSDAFDVRLKELNNIIADSKALDEILNEYYAKSADGISNIFEPLRNRYYLAAKRRGWIPSFIGRQRKLSATNYVCCESHRDKLIYWLSKV